MAPIRSSSQLLTTSHKRPLPRHIADTEVMAFTRSRVRTWSAPPTPATGRREPPSRSSRPRPRRIATSESRCPATPENARALGLHSGSPIGGPDERDRHPRALGFSRIAMLTLFVIESARSPSREPCSGVWWRFPRTARHGPAVLTRPNRPRLPDHLGVGVSSLGFPMVMGVCGGLLPSRGAPGFPSSAPCARLDARPRYSRGQ
jgi:hypothetical protein